MQLEQIVTILKRADPRNSTVRFKHHPAVRKLLRQKKKEAGRM